MIRMISSWRVVGFLLITTVVSSAQSGTVTNLLPIQFAPNPTIQNWTIIAGTGDIQFPTTDNSGITVAQVTVATAPQDAGFTIQYTFPTTMDLRTFDVVSFPIQISQTRVGDYVYLVDNNSNRRWYNLVLQSPLGRQQPVYSIANFVGQDAPFDTSQVVAIRYGQYAVSAGDVITVGIPTLETGLIDHCDTASSWFLDLATSGNITLSTDSVSGPNSILASLIANDQGQGDIAILGTATGILWDLSSKQSVSFYFKDANLSGIYYFLIYDQNRNYREWLFANSSPGKWIKITADLRDNAYFESGPVNLSNIQQFEVGIFGGKPQAAYTFQVDEVTTK